MRLLALLLAAANFISADASTTIISSITKDRAQLNAALGKCKLTIKRDFNRVLVGATADDLTPEQLTCLAGYTDLLVEADVAVTALAVSSWGLDRVDQDLATSIKLDNSFSLASQVSSSTTEVHAFVLDTGIYAEHNDFGGRVSTTTYFNAFASTYAVDRDGHGTHCAGTIGGSKYGVAPNVKLYAAKVLDDNGSGSWSGIISALEWVGNLCTGTGALAGKPCVASMSLGGGFYSTGNNAVNNLVNLGVPVVVAAGNSNANACNYSPASAANALTIGSTDKPGSSAEFVSSFSNYGSCVDLFAPGRAIVSAGITGTTSSTSLSGTSMACPHVAGAVAQLMSVGIVTPADIRAKLLEQGMLNVLSPSTGMGSFSSSNSPNVLLHTYYSADPAASSDCCSLQCKGGNKNRVGTCAFSGGGAGGSGGKSSGTDEEESDTTTSPGKGGGGKKSSSFSSAAATTPGITQENQTAEASGNMVAKVIVPVIVSVVAVGLLAMVATLALRRRRALRDTLAVTKEFGNAVGPAEVTVERA